MRVIQAFTATLCLSGCSGHSRLDEEQAKKDFRKLYPDVEVVAIRMSEDEVIARSFEFTYRWPGDSDVKMINVQYMESVSGAYEIRPEPPKQLP